MHFDASDTFIKMMMDLISSAKDICMVFAICDDLGTTYETDFERQKNTASVALAPRIWEIFNLFRQHAAEHFSSYASTSEGLFLVTTSSFENAWHADSEGFDGRGKLSATSESWNNWGSNPQTKNLFDSEEYQIT